MSKRWILATALVLPLTGCPELDAVLVGNPTGPAPSPGAGGVPVPGASSAVSTASTGGAFEEPTETYVGLEETEVLPKDAQAAAKLKNPADWHFAADGRSGWRQVGDSGDLTLKFQPTLPEPGDYEVQVWVPAGLGTAEAAVFRVYDGAGNHWQWVNQKTKGGTWVSLGTYPHAAASPLHVIQTGAGTRAVDGVDKVATGPVKFVRLRPKAEPTGELKTTEVPTGVRKVRWQPGRRRMAIAVVPHESGFALSYTDTDGNLVVQTLDAEGRPRAEISAPGREVLGFSSAPGGGLAALTQETAGEAPAIHVTTWTASLSPGFETRLMGGEGRGPGQNFAVGQFGTGRLIQAGQQLAAYVEHGRNWAKEPGKEDVHHGDDLYLLDGTGAVTDKATWLVSHGLDQRLAWDGTAVHQLSLGDCYPKGLAYRRHEDLKQRVIFPDQAAQAAFGNCAGGAEGNLGGLVAGPDGAALTFVASAGRDGMDVGFMRLGPDGSVRRSAWLTRTPGLKEERPRLVRLFDGRLVALWRSVNQTFAVTLDADGRPTGPIRPVAAPLGVGDDPAVTASGEIVWAYAKDGTPGLTLVRFRP